MSLYEAMFAQYGLRTAQVCVILHMIFLINTSVQSNKVIINAEISHSEILG